MIPTKYLLAPNISLKQTLEYMDRNKIKFVLIQNEDKLVGTVTDGDIRRGLIKGFDLDEKISSFMNTSFISIKNDETVNETIKIFNEKDINFIPIVDQTSRLYNIITRHVLDALLLMNKEMSFDYDFEDLNQIKIEHEINVRPWGYYKTMVLNETFQSKIIYVLPSQLLSLQSHEKREEHWTIVAGKGRVQLNDDYYEFKPGEIFHIPTGCKHRIINDSSEQTLIFVEVQLGTYFGEDDIQRYEDNYGRK